MVVGQNLNRHLKVLKDPGNSHPASVPSNSVTCFARKPRILQANVAHPVLEAQILEADVAPLQPVPKAGIALHIEGLDPGPDAACAGDCAGDVPIEGIVSASNVPIVLGLT